MEEENNLVQEDTDLETSEEKETPEEKTEDAPEDEKKGEEKDEKKSSMFAQKKHWREKAKTFEKELTELKSQLADKIQKKEHVSDDEAERKAQDYIDKRIEMALEKREKDKIEKKVKEMSAFEAELEEVLEDNPDFTDKQILDICEEEDVTPKIAVKLLKRRPDGGKPKPKIPTPKSANPETKIRKEPRVRSGNFWEVTDRLMKGLKADK